MSPNVADVLLVAVLLLTHADGAAVSQCCRKHKIPEICAKTLCNPSSPPGDFDVYDIFEKRHNCSEHLKTIAQCLADGRNHYHCCEMEAKDREQGACFGLCKGEGLGNLPWNNYQTCIALNLPSMFSCFQKGYENTPSPPQLLTINAVQNGTVHLSWVAPLINPDLAHFYKVVCDENDTTSDQITETTRQMQISLNLQPATKYRCHVVAYARDGKRSSLSSDTVHFHTPGIPPKMSAYRSEVSAPKGATSTILACRFFISGNPNTKRLRWERIRNNKAIALDGDRFDVAYYNSSNHRPREYVTTLEIKNVNADDFGTYRCHVSLKYGDAFAEVELKEATTNRPSSYPPDSPLHCCQYRGVESRCLAMCGLEQKIPNMPMNCSGEIGKVLACAMGDSDDSACCLRSRIPKVCMYLCDSGLTPSVNLPVDCKEHIDSARQCRYEGMLKRPSSVKDVKVSSSSEFQFVVSWKPGERAEMYHVYWKRHHAKLSEWEKATVYNTNKVIQNADEIVVVAANAYGISQPMKLFHKHNKWQKG